MAQQANEADYTFSAEKFPDGLEVLRFSGREEMSRMFRYEIELISPVQDIPLDDLVGLPASLTIRGKDGVRTIHGLVERFEHLSLGRQYSLYRAELVPSVAPLRHTRDSRVFQQLSVPRIVDQVLAGYSLADRLSWCTRGEHSARDYCVQYQESALDFVSRLLEEEGIFFYFEQDGTRDTLVFGDGPHAYAPELEAPCIDFHDESHSASLLEEVVHAFQARATLTPGRATLRDFRFQQPSLDLQTQRQEATLHPRYEVGGVLRPGVLPLQAQLERYEYPGEYVDPEIGRRLVDSRLEALQSTCHLFLGEGTCRLLQPGHRFRLERHAREDFNCEYLVLSIEHHGGQSQVLGEEHGIGQVADEAYGCRFQCIPVEVPYRPARDTSRPVVQGVQSALVVGPPGEEVYCDAYGRVKVQFHWDRLGRRDDHSSCWIRVSHPWAGVAGGALFLPRVGQEVLVQFLEGDPDRPVIIGRVFNGDHPVPYNLPEHRTRSTIKTASSPGGKGYNELRFEDAAGKEEVFLRAQRDLNERVLRNHAVDIGQDQANHVARDQTETIDGRQALTVGQGRVKVVGAYEQIRIEGDRITEILRNEQIQVGLSRSESVGENEAITIAGSRETRIDGDDLLIAANRRHLVHEHEEAQAGSRTRTVDQDDCLVVGGDRLEQVSGDIQRTIAGDEKTLIQGGDFRLEAARGDIRLSAMHDVELGAGVGNLSLGAGEAIAATAGVTATLSAPEVNIVAATRLTLSVGASSIVIDASGVKISGPSINSSAIGLHTVNGALIKIG